MEEKKIEADLMHALASISDKEFAKNGKKSQRKVKKLTNGSFSQQLKEQFRKARLEKNASR